MRAEPTTVALPVSDCQRASDTVRVKVPTAETVLESTVMK